MRRISPGTVTIGVFAILFGLVAAYAARHYFEKEQLVRRAARPKTATVIMPRINLPKYSRIRNQDIEAYEIPVDSVPEGAVQIKSRALFRLVKTTIMAGQPIMEENLFGVGEVPKLADRLPPGYRAVTLQVNANSALNGMIQPESLVDISLTVTAKQPQLQGLATLTLLRGVKVMATSEARFPHSEDRPDSLRNITVAVTPEQANRLILAQRYGSLSVTLCSSLEEAALAEVEEASDLVSPSDLLGLAPLPIEPIPEVIEQKVQIWRGGKMHEVTFGAAQIREAMNATAVSEGREPLPAIPVNSQQPTPAEKECKSCKKKRANAAQSQQPAAQSQQPAAQSQQPAAAAPDKGEPTLANQPTPAAAPAVDPQPSGQVIKVQVEAQPATLPTEVPEK